MGQPTLTVIAGCNGSGKSLFHKVLLKDPSTYFNYDVIYLQKLRALEEYIENKEEIADDLAYVDWLSFIKYNKSKKISFSYETNFDKLPLLRPQEFKEAGYYINIIFFCVTNKGICRKRIKERTFFNEHNVPEDTFLEKWKEGYKNFNEHYSFFDEFLLIDNSINNKPFQPILKYSNKEFTLISDELPDYFERRFPSIYENISHDNR